MKRLHYEIEGMSCASCVAHVERAVKKVLDKNDVFSVSLLTNSISILPYREDLDGEELVRLENRLEEAVAAAGYRLVSNEQKKEQKKEDGKKDLFRLLISAFFTLSVMYLSMGGMLNLPIPTFLCESALWMALSQLFLTLPVVILNFKFFKRGISALLHLSPNMDSLIAIGSGASLIYGVVAIVMIASGGQEEGVHWLHELYFESAASILTLVSFGKLLESRAKKRASDAITSLASLCPKLATVLRDGKEIAIPTEEIEIGETVMIRAGELIPIDGEVTDGHGTVDESALTGESMPVEKESGSKVKAACILRDGAIKVRATGTVEDSSLARIVRLLEDAASTKAPIARIADRVSAIFVPAVMGISLVTLIVWLLITHNVEEAFRSAISVLVISCPCALGLATPTAITVGIGRGAKMGILFRSAESLERICSVDCILFDKTGTLTEGKPCLTDVYAYGIGTQELLSIAASVESYSSHPLARAVTEGAEREGAKLLPVEQFENRIGFGASASINKRVYRIGKPDDDDRERINRIQIENVLPELGVTTRSAVLTERDENAEMWRDFSYLEHQGKTAVAVYCDGCGIGVLGISDAPRKDSKIAIERLHRLGLKCLMLTGDHKKTAAYISEGLGLDGYYASLLPEDKERIVREKSKESSCAMVGDGINDSPALIRADVGIAIGAGTDVAIESADVVLSGQSPTGVADAYALSLATLRIIKQNLFWALFYNAVCIPVAAGVFYPLFGWQLTPMLASLAMSFSSVFVVTNALRLKRVDLEAAQRRKRKSQKKGETKKMLGKCNVYELSVEGMMCQHCVAHVKKALEATKGVKLAEVDLDAKKATVTASCPPEKLIKAIEDAGYKAEMM